jgi:hypothetical protein
MSHVDFERFPAGRSYAAGVVADKLFQAIQEYGSAEIPLGVYGELEKFFHEAEAQDSEAHRTALRMLGADPSDPLVTGRKVTVDEAEGNLRLITICFRSMGTKPSCGEDADSEYVMTVMAAFCKKLHMFYEEEDVRRQGTCTCIPNLSTVN